MQLTVITRKENGRELEWESCGWIESPKILQIVKVFNNHGRFLWHHFIQKSLSWLQRKLRVRWPAACLRQYKHVCHRWCCNVSLMCLTHPFGSLWCLDVDPTELSTTYKFFQVGNAHVSFPYSRTRRPSWTRQDGWSNNRNTVKSFLTQCPYRISRPIDWVVRCRGSDFFSTIHWAFLQQAVAPRSRETNLNTTDDPTRLRWINLF